MDKQTLVKTILQNVPTQSVCDIAHAFAPSNIALCKYWGKRDEELNLPVTSSISVALGNKGAFTSLRFADRDAKSDFYLLNGKTVALNTPFALRLKKFLDLFRPDRKTFYHIETDLNLPIAAGLASSACGFASIVQVLNNFYAWNLPKSKLSILARIGSGSACRSFWPGFVEWKAGSDPAGMDSFAEEFPFIWPDLRLGILTISNQEKSISSREAMQHSMQTSPLYAEWPEQVKLDLQNLKISIAEKDFELFGKTAEANALLMHEIIASSNPPIQYSLPETFKAREKVEEMRAIGAPVYVTQDAGPNLVLLFLAQDTSFVQEVFPEVNIIAPFAHKLAEHVILVNEKDEEVDVLEKTAAHLEGRLHRAFSVFILRQKGDSVEVLLQKRNQDKYHSGGLWSNTCCGHPRPSEDILVAANRRLEEEMGFSTRLEELGSFSYCVKLGKGLIEHEIDHVLAGVISGNDSMIRPNPEEVQASLWLPLEVLQEELTTHPEKFTPWLPEALQIVINKLLAM
ncbi:MAG: diphosphomevalonate decarboxylase [Gammaproteobacteria bacterium]